MGSRIVDLFPKFLSSLQTHGTQGVSGDGTLSTCREGSLVDSDGFYLTTVRGLERICAEEVKEHFGDVVTGLSPCHVFVGNVSAPMDLLRLRVPEDVFACVVQYEGVTRSRDELGRLYHAVRSHDRLTRAFGIWRVLRGKRRLHYVTYRVIARKAGRHNFLRSDVGASVEAAVRDWSRGKWILVPDDAHVEIWAEVDDQRCTVGLRLSDRTMRHRTSKISHIEASLRPTVAAAMVRLTQPVEDDVFCDPMCGTGTILIERALAYRYKELIGGDISPRAVESARINIGSRYKPITVNLWDATNLPLASQSVTAIAVNPPFGRKIGSLSEVQTFTPVSCRRRRGSWQQVAGSQC